jgi:hypothetical protein
VGASGVARECGERVPAPERIASRLTRSLGFGSQSSRHRRAQMASPAAAVGVAIAILRCVDALMCVLIPRFAFFSRPVDTGS